MTPMYTVVCHSFPVQLRLQVVATPDSPCSLVAAILRSRFFLLRYYLFYVILFFFEILIDMSIVVAYLIFMKYSCKSPHYIPDVTRVSAATGRGEGAGYSKTQMFCAPVHFEELFSRGMKYKCGLGLVTDTTAGPQAGDHREETLSTHSTLPYVM